MSVLGTTKMTARQFLMLGGDPPGVRLELVDGEIAVSPSPRPRHSYPHLKLGQMLLAHVEEHDLGIVLLDTDTIFGEFDVRRPDIIYFTSARQHLIKEDEAIEGPPDLCVEIVSPGSGEIDRRVKLKQYARAGVEYYWILDPHARTIEAYRLSGGRYRLAVRGSGDQTVQLPPFADLKIPLGRLWFPRRRK